MRLVTFATLSVLTLLTSVASAKGSRPKPPKSGTDKAKAVSVASAAPLPPLPAVEPVAAPAPLAPQQDPAPANADRPVSSVATAGAPAGPGFVFVFGAGLGFLGGEIAKGLDVSAGFATMDLKLGAYITERVGILAGIQGGYGGLFEGCAGSCSNALTVQLPVVAQVALIDRRHGPYAEGGLAFLNTYVAGTDRRVHPDASPETLKMSSPVDFKLGAGYRIAQGPSGEPSSSSLDLRIGLDLGQFRHVEYRSVAGGVAGDIADDHQATHWNLGLSVAYQFAP